MQHPILFFWDTFENVIINWKWKINNLSFDDRVNMRPCSSLRNGFISLHIAKICKPRDTLKISSNGFFLISFTDKHLQCSPALKVSRKIILVSWFLNHSMFHIWYFPIFTLFTSLSSPWSSGSSFIYSLWVKCHKSPASNEPHILKFSHRLLADGSYKPSWLKNWLKIVPVLLYSLENFMLMFFFYSRILHTLFNTWPLPFAHLRCARSKIFKFQRVTIPSVFYYWPWVKPYILWLFFGRLE